jgi:hypothetical protein
VTDGVMKFLWVVSIGALTPATILRHARASGVQAVCLRTSNLDLPATIATFHEAGLRVYGWRWPSVVRTQRSPSHYFALDEAHFVAQTLIPAGLDGYIVDPESDHPGDVDDWNHEALAPLAREFCRIIRNAAAETDHADFRFGITSGVNFPTMGGKPHIPWSEFIDASDVVYPQAYWRWRRPHDAKVENLHGGKPASAVALGHGVWSNVATGKPIVPIAGELDVITPHEIAVYGDACLKTGSELHFYADTTSVPAANYRAIANIATPAVLVRTTPVEEPPIPKPKPQDEGTDMLQNNSELPGGGYMPPPPTPAGSDWLTRMVGFVRRAWWVIVTLLSLLLAAQSVWPDILKSGSALGPVVQQALETLFDKPAAVRQADYLGKRGLPTGFLGYVYYDGPDCTGVTAGQGTILVLPCIRDPAAKMAEFAAGKNLRINGNVEIREHPWQSSALVAMVLSGQCVRVLAAPVREVASGNKPQVAGLWLPVGRVACPAK